MDVRKKVKKERWEHRLYLYRSSRHLGVQIRICRSSWRLQWDSPGRSARSRHCCCHNRSSILQWIYSCDQSLFDIQIVVIVAKHLSRFSCLRRAHNHPSSYSDMTPRYWRTYGGTGVSPCTRQRLEMISKSEKKIFVRCWSVVAAPVQLIRSLASR